MVGCIRHGNPVPRAVRLSETETETKHVLSCSCPVLSSEPRSREPQEGRKESRARNEAWTQGRVRGAYRAGRAKLHCIAEWRSGQSATETTNNEQRINEYTNSGGTALRPRYRIVPYVCTYFPMNKKKLGLWLRSRPRRRRTDAGSGFVGNPTAQSRKGTSWQAERALGI